MHTLLNDLGMFLTTANVSNAFSSLCRLTMAAG